MERMLREIDDPNWGISLERKKHVFVAEKEGKIVGYCMFDGNLLNRLFVNPSERGMGRISSQLLMRAMFSYLKKEPTRKTIHLIASPDIWTKEPALIRWYERHGFSTSDRTAKMTITRKTAFEFYRKFMKQPAIQKKRNPIPPRLQRKHV
ncbi:MAG: GNAT family N-acetyltransferase [archaeon]|nr:GNAT family N-acetyltransferase [archaeon]